MFWLRIVLALLIPGLGFGALAAPEGTELDPIYQRVWYEARTTHGRVFSCGPSTEVARVAVRLEQFREAYAALAGTQAVASPPIVVMAFPDVKSMRPFLPLYHGAPANLAGFFKRGTDENLIVLSLSGGSERPLDVIFHEYAHLLLRRNDRIWPLWLKEGMADVYSTFTATGRQMQIGAPIEGHLKELADKPLLPLAELFAVKSDSADYNEAEHQGVFYAEAWLLTHYLYCGDVPVRKERFGQFMLLLQQGVRPETAFTRAFQTTLPAMEAELRGYLARGRFGNYTVLVGPNLSAPRPLRTRPLGRGETSYWLGNILARIGRPDGAEPYFLQSRKLAPQSPLGREGLGFLAVTRHQDTEAADFFKDALQHGSTNFLAHYWYAKVRYEGTSDGHDRYTTVSQETAAEIRGGLQKAIALMPEFGPAHSLLGFLELVQGDYPAAEQQLLQAIQLEPENQWHLLTLAQAQLGRKDTSAARRTLEPLMQPNSDEKLRARAEELLRGARRP